MPVEKLGNSQVRPAFGAIIKVDANAKKVLGAQMDAFYNEMDNFGVTNITDEKMTTDEFVRKLNKDYQKKTRKIRGHIRLSVPGLEETMAQQKILAIQTLKELAQKKAKEDKSTCHIEDDIRPIWVEYQREKIGRKCSFYEDMKIVPDRDYYSFVAEKAEKIIETKEYKKIFEDYIQECADEYCSNPDCEIRSEFKYNSEKQYKKPSELADNRFIAFTNFFKELTIAEKPLKADAWELAKQTYDVLDKPMPVYITRTVPQAKQPENDVNLQIFALVPKLNDIFEKRGHVS